MKHEAYDLKQMQSLPLELKIKMTQRRISEWYEYWAGMVYVSFSGGKDSTVLKHIVDQMYDDVPSVFVNTGLEYPEIQKFAMSQPNVTAVRPDMRFDEVIKKYGYPVISKEVAKNVYYARKSGEDNVHYKKLFGLLMKDGKKSKYCTEKYSYLFDAPFMASHYCCDIMKKRPAHKYEKETGRRAISGTMAAESRQRLTVWLRTGCNAFEGKHPMSNPMAFWTEQDVLQYIVKYNIPYCSIYGDIVPDDDQLSNQECFIEDNVKLKTTGCDRTGCIFCAFGAHLDREPNRFKRIAKTHPKQYKYCIGGGEYIDGIWQPNKDGLGMGKVLDYIGVDYTIPEDQE